MSVIEKITAIKEHEAFSASALFLAKTRPFVSSLFMSLKRVPLEGVTMGVGLKDNRLVLYYSPDFVRLAYALSPMVLANVIKHEVLHIVLHHTDEACKYDNKIADLFINHLIRDLDKPLTPAVVPCPICMNSGGTLESYIDDARKTYSDIKYRLGTHRSDCPLCGNSRDVGLYIGIKTSANADTKQVMDALTTMYANKGTDNGPSLTEAVLEKYPKEEAEFLIKCFGNNGAHFELSGSEEADYHMKACLQEALKKCREIGAGTGSNSVYTELAGLAVSTQKKIDWKKYLRTSICNNINSELESTRLRRNRRFGFQYPGTKKKYRCDVVVCIDTSASMSDTLLSDIANDIKGLGEKDVNTTVVEFDYNVQRTYPLGKADKGAMGRGGTDLGAPMRWLVESNIAAGTVVFVFTDGAGPLSMDTKLLNCYNIHWMLPNTGITNYIQEAFRGSKQPTINKFNFKE